MTELGDLLAVLDLGPLDPLSPFDPAGDRFQARSLHQGQPVVFGGQLLAQAVIAATRAVPDKAVLSLHAVFSRAASPDGPLELLVEPVHSGRSFATVAVTISQEARVCAKALALLHEPDPDLIRHAAPSPSVTLPDDLPSRTTGLWDLRLVDGVDLSDPDATGPPELRLWVRFPDAPDDPTIGQALLAYASDGFLIGTAMRPHAGIGQSMAHVSIATTVLTQTLSFHEPFTAGGWLLFDQRSTYAGRGRSRGRAEVFRADGRLVASFGQDNMIRR